jgi:hypothetical protein
VAHFRARPTGWVNEPNRHRYAAMGIRTGRLRSLNGYVHRNVASQPHKDFLQSVKWSIHHPWKDMDGKYKSMRHAAHQDDTLAPVGSPERVEQRATATVGRVVTLENVEPMVDPEESKRPFRQQAGDWLFGRDSREELQGTLHRPRSHKNECNCKFCAMRKKRGPNP